MDVAAELAKLQAKRAEAAGRIAAVEAEARMAGEALVGARERLIQFERRDDGRPSDRAKLEAALAAAEAKVAQPWAQRLDGLRRRLTDHDRAVAEFVRGNLGELLDRLEEDGRLAAERVDAAGVELVDAHREREAVARRITELCSKVGRAIGPGDVSYSRAEEAARAATALAMLGGEEPPTLDRSRQPWRGILEQQKAAATA